MIPLPAPVYRAAEAVEKRRVHIEFHIGTTGRGVNPLFYDGYRTANIGPVNVTVAWEYRR
jgi:hypothetical protein